MFKRILRKLVIKYFELIPFRKGKDRLFHLAREKSLLNEPFVFRFRRGVRMYIDINDFIQVNVFFHRYYERLETLVWIELSKGAKIIFDIGANVGYYSLVAATNPNARIYSFEPVTPTFKKLEKNRQLNNFLNIQLNQRVVSDTNSKVRIFLGDPLNRGMSSITKSDSLSSEFEDAESVVLDEFCRIHSIETIDLVKIDVEGSEMLVLKGMARILESLHPVLMIEVTNETLQKFGYSIFDVYKFLAEKGYQPYKMIGDRTIQKIHTPEEQLGLILFAHLLTELSPDIIVKN
jgi:FkbM family methyltransferase